jgi:acyl carrier protein
LVQSGATHLVLSGRQSPSRAAKDAVMALETGGATVRVFAADAADRTQTQSVLGEIASSMPPLRGVVHAAGTVHDGVLMNQRWADCAGVLRGKAHGAWLLHELTRDLPLDFFVLYSAAGVVLGAAGQGAYPAANAELDALARARHRLGLPALSVAWGPWADVGMAARLAENGQHGWEERGLAPLSPSEALEQLGRLLGDGATYGAVMRVNWRRLLARLPVGTDGAFFSNVVPDGPLGSMVARVDEVETFASRIRALPSGQRMRAMIDYLSGRTLHMLGLDLSTPVDSRRPLKDIGLDSLMAVELRNALSRAAGQSLPATLLFDYPTLETLAGHLLQILRLDADVAASGDAARERSAAEATVAALSDDDAEAALMAELDSRRAGDEP